MKQEDHTGATSHVILERHQQILMMKPRESDVSNQSKTFTLYTISFNRDYCSSEPHGMSTDLMMMKGQVQMKFQILRMMA